MRRLFALSLALALAACGGPATESTDAAPPAPAAAPADTAPADTAPADAATTPGPDAAAADTAAEPAPAEGAPAEAAPPAPAPVELPAAALDPARAPREGIDYTVLPSPQPTFSPAPGIEVAEVFSYTCIHCANLQPSVSQWKPTLPADVRFIYVPAAFGGPIDNFARGFFAAESLGLLDKTHDAAFRAFFVERRFPTGSEEEVADWYASQGANRDTFLSTMKSFAVDAKLNRARQFALRTGVDSTPNVIIAGKYRAVMTGDRGPQGLIDTIEVLVARERAAAAAR